MTKFELSGKFQPLYKSGKSICVTSDGYIIADDGENINYLDRKNLQKIDQFNERNEEITCFVAGCDDYIVILANKNLMLKKIDRLSRSKRHTVWKSNHTSPIFTMCMNKSSTRLTTGGADNKVRIWHIGEGEGMVFNCAHHKSKISVLKNHPTNEMVVSSSLLDHEIVAWDTETGKKLGIFAGHQGIVTGIDFHADTNQMATSSRDETVIVWNCDDFTKILSIPALESIETCVILTGFMNQPEVDEYLIMVGGLGGVMRTISPHNKSIVQEFKKASLFTNILPGDVDSDKSCLRAITSIMRFDKSIIVARESDNIEFYSEQMELEYELAGDLSDVKDILMVGRNKDIILAVESAPYMRLFSCKSYFEDVETGKEEDSEKLCQWPSRLICGGHTKEITSVSVFNDGLMIASGGKDGRVCVWRVEENAKLQLKLIASITAENDFVVGVCVDRNGKLIYVNYSVDDTLTVLSFENNELTRLASVRAPHKKPISVMAVNINSSLLATGSKDKTVRLWSYQNETKEIIDKGILKAHRRCITSVQFSDHQQILLTSALDKIMFLWSIETLEIILTFQAQEMIHKALFYNNEKQIISCDSKGVVTVWNANNRGPIYPLFIHEGSVDCLTLVYDSQGKCKGFAAGGNSSMICLYKDVSEKYLEKLKEEKEIENEGNQQLDNLLFEKKFVGALRLAIKLNKPLLTYNVLNAINANEVQIDTEIMPDELLDGTNMGRFIQKLDKDELKKLVMFSSKWISNQKTMQIGELIIALIYCLVPDLELISWPEYTDNLDAIQYYSERNRLIWQEALDSTGFLDYLLDAAKATHFIDLSKDKS